MIVLVWLSEFPACGDLLICLLIRAIRVIGGTFRLRRIGRPKIVIAW
jgi:hypothetical protein